jgi:hypothetical protein
MYETNSTFIDDDGNRYDLTSDVYNPQARSVNDMILGGIASAIKAGRAPYEF